MGYDPYTTSVWQRLQLARALSEGIPVSIAIHLDSGPRVRKPIPMSDVLSTVI